MPGFISGIPASQNNCRLLISIKIHIIDLQNFYRIPDIHPKHTNRKVIL
jgi:hypothetical protein